MTTTTTTAFDLVFAYENKNTHEARNEALTNGNKNFADLIWTMWDKLAEDDPMVDYDEYDFRTNLEWLREMGEYELANKVAEAAGNVYGTEVEEAYRSRVNYRWDY